MSDPTSTTTDTLPPTPECDRMIAVSEESRTISDFLDWLGPHGMLLAEYVQHPGFRDRSLVPASRGFDALLAQYFRIDLAKVDRERRALLTHVTAPAAANAAVPPCGTPEDSAS